DRDHGIPHLHLFGLAEREGADAVGVVDLEQRDVGGGIGADDLRALGVTVAQLDLDVLGALDDMRVGEYVPVVVDQEARARGGALLLLWQAEYGPRPLAHGRLGG